jgi:hypothetical protein
MVNKLNTFKVKGNGKSMNYYSMLMSWNIFIWNITFRPQEFVPLASTEVCAADNSYSDDSSLGNSLFVNTNRPQCIDESSDSSENEMSDSGTNKND